MVSKKKIRIGYAAFSHESNSFAYQPASLDKWKEWGILYGEDIRAEYETSKASIAGYYGRLRDEVDVELVPLVFARLCRWGRSLSKRLNFYLVRFCVWCKSKGRGMGCYYHFMALR